MKIPFFGLTSFFIALTAALPPAQALPDPEAHITHQYGDNYALMWHGHAGNTYFIQTNTGVAADGSFTWDFVPDIRSGSDATLGMGFEVTSNPEVRLYRLLYTNQAIVIDHNLDDFDGDGVTNLEEALDNTDPFDPMSFLLLDGSNYNGSPPNNGGSASSSNNNLPTGAFQLIHSVGGGIPQTYTIEPGDPIPTFDIIRDGGRECA